MRRNASAGPFRADIEGLRAVAVLLVVLTHLTSWPSGGFVGVDVFFVISGYLITGQLVREKLSTGRIDLSAFLRRRIRRLGPAALVVSALTLAATSALWYPARSVPAAGDALASLALIANWHFASEGIDYFAVNSAPSPFEHFWSLSVEEQFYLFWPTLLVGCGLIASRFFRLDGRRALTAGVMALTALSMGWAIVVDGHFPRQGYFDTLGRGWEFGAGALVALLRRDVTKSPRFGHAAQCLGLVAIFASALILPGGPPIPTALLPVAATALVIAAGSVGNGAPRSPLASAFLWIGRSSYSIYLWHLPLIVITLSIVPSDPLLSTPIVLVLVVALGGLTHRFVETPARRARPRIDARGRADRATRTSGRRPHRAGRATGMIAAVVVLLSALQTWNPSGLLRSENLEARVHPTPRESAQQLFPSREAVLAATVNAPRSGAPTSLPSLPTVASNQASPAVSGPESCLNEQGSPDWRSCRFGSPGTSGKAAVIGDSIAMSWTPTITDALRGWQVDALGFASCGPFAVDDTTEAPSPMCAASRRTMIEWARHEHPDVIFLSSSPGDFERFARGSTDAAARAAWADAVGTTIEALQDDGAHVVVLTSPPEAPDARTCATRLTGIANCIGTVTNVQRAKARAEAQAVARFGGRGPGATLVDSGSWFCTDEGICPIVIGGYLARVDRVHATNAFSESLAPVLRTDLLSAGVITS